MDTPESFSVLFFSPEKLALLALLKEIQPSPDRKTIKVLTFDILFPPLWHSRENSEKNDDDYHIFPPKWRWFTRQH